MAMRIHRSAMVLGVLLTFGIGASAQGDLLLQAQMDVDPRVENATWQLLYGQAFDSIAGGVASYNSQAPGHLAYVTYGTAVGTFNHAVVIRATMRVLSDNGYNGGGTAIALIRDGYFYITGIVSQNGFHSAAVRALDAGGGIIASSNLDASVFHIYDMVITDAATGKYDIYVDGDLTLANNQAQFIGAGYDGQIQFGDIQSTPQASGEFDLVQIYDAYPVPEPASLGLLLTAGLLACLPR